LKSPVPRAIVRKPKLLVLDEATTALDPKTETAICQTLRKLRGENTILAISHQTAVLEVADRAYQIQDGAVIPVDVPSADSLNGEDTVIDSEHEIQAGSVIGKM
jgi:ABC-type bacteriocin/lantibiotic exporter with double-glycine peptidase domain